MVNKLVLPGQSIGISEEAAPGNGTFEDDGVICATVAGTIEIDSKRRVSVKAANKGLRQLQHGDDVYAVIHDIYASIALVQLTPMLTNSRIAMGNSFAFIRISEIQRGFVEEFRDYLRIGDVLKAKIKEVTPLGTYITVMEPGLGVIKAFCSRCRTELKISGTTLTCPQCGNKEYRKLA